MSNLHINTTQNVKLFFTPASVGERMLAYGVDLLVKTAYVIVVVLLFTQLLGIDDVEDTDFFVIGLIIIFMLPLIFYTLLFETLMEGQTLGKKLVKIKVVKIDGYQAGFFEFLIRWIFTIVDIQMSYVPGLISMVSTKHTQRLGDLAAGTAVITEKSKYNISHTILMEVEDEYKPYFAQNQIMLFSDNDIRIIKENSELAFKQGNYQIIDKLARKITAVMSINNPFKSDRQLIDVLLKDYNYYTSK